MTQWSCPYYASIKICYNYSRFWSNTPSKNQKTLQGTSYRKDSNAIYLSLPFSQNIYSMSLRSYHDVQGLTHGISVLFTKWDPDVFLCPICSHWTILKDHLWKFYAFVACRLIAEDCNLWFVREALGLGCGAGCCYQCHCEQWLTLVLWLRKHLLLYVRKKNRKCLLENCCDSNKLK